MKNFKYFPISQIQQEWGIYLTDCGKETIPPNYKSYPPAETPETHAFTWQKGRILKEYYLVYVAKGRGFYENRKTGLHTIAAGSVFIVFASEWYRHRPDPATGWECLWVGFQGEMAQRLVNRFFSPKEPVIALSKSMDFEIAMRDFVENTVEAPLAYPLSTGGQILELLGRLLELKEMDEPGSKYYYAIRKAQAHILHHAFETIDYHKLASKIGVSETTFRRNFLKLAHQTPLQFQLTIRLKHACKLLEETDFPISEIAQKIGFELPHYFTRLFTAKMGHSPKQHRNSFTKRLASEK
jgi:AraC-like DNA-binding protein